MKTRLAFAIALALVLALPAFSQRPNEPRAGEPPRGETQRPGGQERPEPRSGEMQRPAQPEHNPPRANQGRIPAPPPQRAPRAKLEPDRRDGGRVNNMPHVSNDRWYGHDKPNDKRYQLDRPFEHGRFERFGPAYRYNIARIDPNLHRFWLPDGYFFEIPAWDWPLAADWCWSCDADDFVIYEDPDHPGWYLLYNLHTGAFVHVMYMGT
jgi:hypothetical protein